MSARDPEAILAELGQDLRAAWARPPRRRLLARWPRGLVLILALLALVPTALATRDAIWAPDPAPLPVGVRPPGAVTPQRTGAQVYVTAGCAPSASSSRCPEAGEGRAATSPAAGPAWA